ncbi:MAG: DUF1622 domain-containing protein [Synechococcales cyanobacterium C42_A2020_086]|jgi:uncharacterized membrane protein|nr:DUF1622 domain-containing protein [Synechococcales cyanobacterium M58_A2018_015]MBF2072283.1 DUF1622 domain-containing protein [Synechococcales cyanobacterium C42_A2020_086]
MWSDLLEVNTYDSGNNGFTLWTEHLLQEVAFFLKVVLEFIAVLIVAIALVRTIQKYIRYLRHRNSMAQPSVRLELGLSLALSLEFLLAADIVGTAVSPDWQAIAKLAAITGIRTFLNFFLHREVRELQELPSSVRSVEPQGMN